MNNKQLAEMIKRLRKERKESELETTDMNTTSHMKGASHDVSEELLKEYPSRAKGTHPYKGNLTPVFRQGYRKQVDITKAGPGLQNKYKMTPVSEDKEEEVTKTVTNSKKNKDTINTKPEQDSAMIGTQ